MTITGAPGTWSFSASKSGYDTNSWSQSITVTDTKHAYLVKTAPLPGDVDRNGKVDILDLNLVASSFNSKAGMPNWNPDADLNRDDIVDIFDLTIVGRNFGKTG